MPSIKDVKRVSGDHHIQTTNDIHLETQFSTGNNGTVWIYGNLNVIGTTTTIESNELVIGDKILVLNKNEQGLNNGALAGVSGDGISGLSIARGGPSAPNENANLVYNQNKNWSYGGNTNSGMWEFLVGPATGGIGNPSGITISAIRTGSSNRDLSLLGAENPSATVTLSGVLNYTSRIVNRNNPDDVPNKGYVDYAIEGQPDRRRLQLNYRNNLNILVQDPTNYLELVDVAVPGYAGVVEPQLRMGIGGNQWVTAYNNRIIIGDIKILDSNEITMEAPNTSMILSTNPSGGTTQNPSVELHTSLSLKIDTVYDEPTSSGTAVKIYSRTEGNGNTGIYFVNSNNRRDELPSKRRSFFASLVL
jgi:hypothetical protein